MELQWSDAPGIDPGLLASLWFPAVVLNLDDPARVRLRIIGYDAQVATPRANLRPCEIPSHPVDARRLREGAACEAKYVPDGQWYRATVHRTLTQTEAAEQGGTPGEGVTPVLEGENLVSEVMVQYEGFDNVEKVPVEYLRPGGATDVVAATLPERARAQRKAAAVASVEETPSGQIVTKDPLREFVVPTSLEILPEDPPATRRHKRHRIKLLRHNFLHAKCVSTQEHNPLSSPASWAYLPIRGSVEWYLQRSGGCR